MTMTEMALKFIDGGVARLRAYGNVEIDWQKIDPTEVKLTRND